MKLNSLGVERLKFIVGSISQVFKMCTVCDTAHVNWVRRVTTDGLCASIFQEAK